MRDGLIAAVYVLALVLGLTGCAVTKFVPPSSDVRQHLGKIAAVALPTQSLASVDKPVSGAGSGALMGAGQAAGASLAGGAMAGCHDPLGCVVGLALGAAVAIVAAPVGAVVGAANAHSEEEVRTADSSLKAALADVKPSQELAMRLAAATKLSTSYDMTVVPPSGGSEDFHNLSANGFGSVIEVAITEFQLLSEGKIDPDVTLVIAAEVRLRHAADGSELYRRKWAYIGTSHNYFKMAAGGATMLRSEIQSGLGKLGDRIFTDLFVSNSPELKETSPRPGTVVTTVAPILQDHSATQQPAPTAPISAPTSQQIPAP